MQCIKIQLVEEITVSIKSERVSKELQRSCYSKDSFYLSLYVWLYMKDFQLFLSRGSLYVTTVNLRRDVYLCFLYLFLSLLLN